MKTLIVYMSVHHGNTEKIAKAIAGVLKAKLVKANEADAGILSKFDLIGFGSGIYFGKHHKKLLELVDKLPIMKKKAFLFSTSGSGRGISGHGALRDKLTGKGFSVVDEFSCNGFDTFGPFALIGGLSKGRPNEEDVKKAKEFARSLKEKF
jgi:flavodoxin